MALLPQAEIEQQIRLLDQWQIEGAALVHDYSFVSFGEVMEFVIKVAALAEAADHHPDIDIRYNKVRLSLVSHDLGGITRRDLKMAAAIDALSAF